MNLFSLCALLGRSRSKACRRHSCSRNAKAHKPQLKPSDCLKLAFAGAGRGCLSTCAACKSNRRVWLAASYMLGFGKVSQYLTYSLCPAERNGGVPQHEAERIRRPPSCSLVKARPGLGFSQTGTWSDMVMAVWLLCTAHSYESATGKASQTSGLAA